MKPHFFLVLFCLSLCLSCSDDYKHEYEEKELVPAQSRAVSVPDFDWETADWMPVPPGQTRIPVPWTGQGSINADFGLDIAFDFLKKDGWELVYSTFDSNAQAPLMNPYFMLYNKYNGLLRIYLYVTSNFVVNSSYIKNALVIDSSVTTGLLNFMGNGIVDINNRSNTFIQVQPAILDGFPPMASYKWYMAQYEMAYDPQISTMSFNQIQMHWHMSFCNISKISLNGNMEGTIRGTIGSSGSENVLSQLGDIQKEVGTGFLAGIGSNFLSKNQTDSNGSNKLGLSKDIFNSLTKGIKSAISSSVNGLPGAAIGLFSSIFKGGSSPTLVDLKINTYIYLKGTATDQGSFPSSPTSFWIPNTKQVMSAPGYVPKYNESFGVFNLRAKPMIIIDAPYVFRNYTEDFTGISWYEREQYFNFPPKKDYSHYLVFNPDVLRIADIVVRNQEVLFLECGHPCYNDKSHYSFFGFEDVEAYEKDRVAFVNPKKMKMYEEDSYKSWYFQVAIRFTIDVIPKNGDTPTTIVKTFLMNSKINYRK